MPMPQGRGNIGVGGNDPTVASNIQQTSNMVNPPAPAGPPGMPQGTPGMAPQGQPQFTSKFAQLLAMAFSALLDEGHTPENLSALNGFVASLQQVQGQQQPPQAPMGGQAPLPPQGGQAPLPPM
jgi:hypothetical protein